MTFETRETLLFLMIIVIDILIWLDGKQVRKDSRETLNLYREYFSERKSWRESQRKSRTKKIETVQEQKEL